MKGIPVSIGTFMMIMSVFVIMIGGSVLFFSLLGAADSMGMAEWPSTQGSVVDGIVYSEWFPGSRHSPGYYEYYPRVTYTYNVSGIEYSCDKIWRVDHLSKSANEAQGVVNSYPSGTTVTVYYDPSGPGQAVLDRTEEVNVIVPVLIGAILLALGIGGLIYAIRRQKKVG